MSEAAAVPVRNRPLIELGSLSSVASFVAIVIAIVTGVSKLNSIDARSRTNCQLLAGGIVLTLEASKQGADPRGRSFLLTQQQRFDKIAAEC